MTLPFPCQDGYSDLDTITLNRFPVQLKCRVKRSYSQLQVLFCNNHRDLDLGRRDNLDINAFSGKRLKHLGWLHPHESAYLHPTIETLAILSSPSYSRAPSSSQICLANIQCALVIIAMYSKGKIRSAIISNVLNNHIHFNIGCTDWDRESWMPRQEYPAHL